MTALLTIIDDVYSASDNSGRRRLFFTVSLTNPYTAGGELLNVSSYFNQHFNGSTGALAIGKFLGGKLVAVNPSVTTANKGIASTATFVGDTNSITTVALQLFNAGLSATANAGLFVDNTTANLSGTTIQIELIGY